MTSPRLPRLLRVVDLAATVPAPTMPKQPSKAGVRRERARSLTRWAAPLLALGLGGCPTGARLTDPDEHLDAQSCVAPDIFSESCAGVACHTPSPNGSVAGVIDLVTPGFESALIDRPSDYSAVQDAEECPPAGAELIVNTRSPEASLLIRKTSGGHVCGLSMPPPGYPPLSQTALDCIRDFTVDLATRQPVPSGAAGQGGGP